MPLGQTSAPLALTFTFDTAGTLGLAPAVVAQGASTGDFQAAGTGTTLVGPPTAYGAGATGTLMVTFQPTGTGLRAGAVQLVDAARTPLATVYLTGTGTGPLAAFVPATETAVTSALQAPGGLAVDAAGLVYVADSANPQLVTETPQPGGTTQGSAGGGFGHPVGVALDGAGNLFVADGGAAGGVGHLYQRPFQSSAAPEVVDFNVTAPTGVAADAAGNVVVADLSYQTVSGPVAAVVKELPPQGNLLAAFSYIYTPQVVDSGFSSLAGVAVDGSGNIYVVEPAAPAVWKEAPQPGGGYVKSMVTTNLSVPTGVAVDGNGNVYIADGPGLGVGPGGIAFGGNDRILLEAPAGTGYQETVLLQNPMAATVINGAAGFPKGLAVDGHGGVFIAGLVGVVAPDGTQSVAGAVSKLDLTAPGQVTLAPNLVGVADTQPVTATVLNLGNQPLAFPEVAAATGPALPAGSPFSLATTFPGTGAGALNPGVNWVLSFGFTPPGNGPFSASLVLTDNDLNAASATQTIPLSGQGPAQVPAQTVPPAPAGGSAPTITQDYSDPAAPEPLTYALTVDQPAGTSLASTGLSFDSGTGVLTGTPAISGTLHLTITGRLPAAKAEVVRAAALPATTGSDPVYVILATLVIQPGQAGITLGDLVQTEDDDQPRAVTVTTVPSPLPVRVTYDGHRRPPTGPGRYRVEVTTLPGGYWQGSACGWLVVLPRHHRHRHPERPERPDSDPFDRGD